MRRFARSLLARSPAQVFAVDHEVVQVTWRPAPAAVEVHRDGAVVATGPPGAAGAATLPLVDAAPGRIAVVAGGRSLLDTTVAPLAPPPGAELCRLATISDLHFGSEGFDHDDRMREVPEPAVPHWARCTEAALRELEEWGAAQVLVKGDVTHRGARDAWALAARSLATTPLPLHGVPGNHDTSWRAGRVDPYRAIAGALLPLTPWVAALDVPGLRVVLCNTTIPHRGRGRLGHLLPALTDLAADARRDGRAVLVVGHHHVNPQAVPVFWPIGIDRTDGETTLAAVRRANPDVAYVAGHTHRHRRRTVGGVTHVEVGSPKDHPGVWAGYVVHEGGLVQTVRRVARPDCLRWTEQTRAAAHGSWGHWSPGDLTDRCFALRWSHAGRSRS